MNMGKRKTLILVLLLGILIFSTDVFALTASSTVTSFPAGDDITWQQSLSFSGPDPVILDASLNLSFSFNPEKVENKVYVEILTTTLDSYTLGEYRYQGSNAGTVTDTFSAQITDQSVLNALTDGTATIRVTEESGTHFQMNSSILTAHYNVAPEPVSMALVGVGMVGLPFARRFKKFTRKTVTSNA
jgi:hypothetical protein